MDCSQGQGGNKESTIQAQTGTEFVESPCCYVNAKVGSKRDESASYYTRDVCNLYQGLPSTYSGTKPHIVTQVFQFCLLVQFCSTFFEIFFFHLL